MSRLHRYETQCSWEGSTGVGYEAYDRGHTARALPAVATLALSSDPAFRGDPARTNPEQLLVVAASSCQLLSFLAAAARARLDVVGYTDEAEGVMPEDDPPTRITAITLRPHVTVRAAEEADPVKLDARIRHLLEVGHRECYIANSVRTEITLDAKVTIV